MKTKIVTIQPQKPAFAYPAIWRIKGGDSCWFQGRLCGPSMKIAGGLGGGVGEYDAGHNYENGSWERVDSVTIEFTT